MTNEGIYDDEIEDGDPNKESMVVDGDPKKSMVVDGEVSGGSELDVLQVGGLARPQSSIDEKPVASMVRSHSIGGEIHGIHAPYPVLADILRKEPEQETVVSLMSHPLVANKAVRWKAGQRRKRWTEQAMALPLREGLIRVQEEEADESAAAYRHFAQQLHLFGHLPSTFAQIAATKALSDALLPALKCTPTLAKAALCAYVELLFLENSRPLHRGLLSTLSRLSKDMENLVADALCVCCLEYGGDGGIKHRRFSSVGVVTSVANLPQPGILKGAVQHCLNLLTLLACSDVAWVLECSNQGGRPPPKTMEDCQDAMGSLYYMLQHYPHCFTQPGIAPGTEETSFLFIYIAGSNKIPQQSQTWMELPRHTVYGIVFQTLIDVLQTSALSRDCVVAAGVGLCAAVQLQNTSEQVALLLENSIFASPETQCVATLSAEPSANSGTVEAFMAGVRSLSSQVSKFTEFGRLCVLRGLLTALPRPTLNIPLLIKKDGICGIPEEWKAWTILYDGVLPALCTLCEGSVDSHFKFHTVTALQICMQQVRASVTGNLTQDALKRLDDVRSAQRITICGYDPLSSTMISRVLQVVWNNWEDPLTQTVKQVQAVFDILVDVHFIFAQQRNTEKNENMEMSNGDFVKQIAANLLAEGRYRKGKYVPLASLATRIGALKLLSMNPNLLFDTFLAQSDDDVCCSASSFLKTFLERLKEDCWSSQGGVMEGELAFRRLWIPPLLSVLLLGNARLRSNLNTYALPVAMRIDPDSVIPIVAFILDGAGRYQDRGSLKWDELNGVPGLPSPLSMHQRIAALISVLKVARSLALIDGDIEENLNARMSSPRTIIGDKLSSLAETVIVRVQNETVQIPVVWLEQALTHLDDSLRVDAAELICLNPKTATMPSTLELQMLLISIPLNMRCSSTFFRMRWTSLLRKFFQRVRTAAWRQHRLKLDSQSVSLSSSAVSYGDDKKKKRAMQTRGRKEVDNHSEFKGNEDNEQLLQSGVAIFKMQEFMQLLSQYLLSSLYPSAPYERKNMAMELLNAIFEVWSLSPEINPSGMTCPVANDFSPYQAGLLSTEATLVVVGAIVDSWDKLRESAFRILVRYPTPLPGLDSKISIERIIHWAKGLVCSPRVRESDAGALVLRLIFRKYVLDLGWTIDVHSVAVDTHLGSKVNGQGLDRIGLAIAEYVESLNDWLEWGIEEGDRDLVKACSHSFVHGVLLSLRYTMEELPWTSVEVQFASSQLMAALHKLISLLLRVTSLSLWVVSANALNLPRDMAADSQAGGFDDILAVNADDDNFEEGDGVAPVEQMIMVGCWLSMKEVSLLLGTIAREVPLSSGSAEGDNGSLAVAEAGQGLLNTEQLEAMGEHFLEVLLAMKHNGAIDKTRAGFIALCDRLLRSSDPRLNKLPETWMKQLLERTGAKGQTVDNLLRRSAGIPAAFLALFLAEPDGAPKKLLPMAMRWLIDTSNKFVCASKKATSETADLEKSVPEDLVFIVKTGQNLGNQEKMKERDEGVVPTVHAFNAMRVAFHDTNLATDTSGFCAEGLITTIQAFSCPHWEVRNSATLAFTALVHRMIGFLNVYKRESARRAITGFEFFHRFPTLHPFLLEELRSATLQLQRDESNRGYRGHGMASTLHPSLGPVLIILSRLKPSVISSGVGDWLSPSAFRSYVSSCATQANLHVRVLASRALAPLVSSEDLTKVLLELAQSLPSSPGPKHVLSYNEVHGVLLQMTVLLTSNCITLPDLDMRSDIVMQLMTMLEQRWWLGSIQHCNCYMVVGSFISMLQGMMNLVESCSQVGAMNAVMRKIQRHLLQLCSECLEVDSSDRKRWAESMQVTLKEQAAKLYFSTALTAWLSQSKVLPMAWVSKQNVDSNSASEITTSDKELLVKDLSQMFRTALTHQMYEVRLATLKVLKKFSSSLISPTKEGIEWVWSCLQSLLVERLDLETHPGCVRRILLVFFAWRAIPQKQSLELQEQGQVGGNMIGWDTSSLVMWDRILHIYRTSKHTKTKEVAMRCMGACLNQMRDHVCHAIEGNSGSIGSVDFTNWKHMKGAVDDWIDLVNKHSAASESINFRRATAEAVVASGLLEQVSWVASRIRTDLNEGRHEAGMAQWYGKSILQLWCVCVKLLEDEDSELRQTLALSLQEVLVHSFRTKRSAYPDSAVPSQVEHVVQLVFQCLSECFGTWKEYWEVLAEWVLGFEDIAALLVHDVDLVRRLFDKEIDNHHEEELIFVQLCCRYLRQLVCYNSKSSPSETQVWISERGSSSEILEGQVEFLTAWRERFLEQAKLCAELTVCMQGKMSWVGGVTNHQDAFKMVYRRLLGLLTFAGPCADNLKVHVRSQILEISRLLQQLPLNPLVSNLMYKVLQAYEKDMGIDLSSSAYRLTMGLAFCDKFEPLFLIE